MLLVGNWCVLFLPDCGICSEHDSSAGSYQRRQAPNIFVFVIILPRSSLVREEGKIFHLRFCLKHHARSSTSQVSAHVHSDFRTNPALDKTVTVQGDILRSLISSVELLDVCSFDQSEYLANYSKTPRLGLEQDAKYFWIFRNLDYEKWVQRREVKILGLHGPSIEGLELAASHIVWSLRNPDTASRGRGVIVLLLQFDKT